MSEIEPKCENCDNQDECKASMSMVARFPHSNWPLPACARLNANEGRLNLTDWFIPREDLLRDCADHAVANDWRLKKAGFHKHRYIVTLTKTQVVDVHRDMHNIVVIDSTDQIRNLEGWVVKKVIPKGC